jgi:hypothetical protein
MKTCPSTHKWKSIEISVLDEIKGTTENRELSHEQWPQWAASSTQFNRISICCDINEDMAYSPTEIIAKLITERIDIKDYPEIYNYNTHFIAETTDGRFYLSPPLILNDPIHHSSSPSTWFDNLGSPL